MTSDPGADSGAQADEQGAAGQVPDAAGAPQKRKHARPRMTASILSIDGLCTGNVRSTPTP